MAHFTQPDPIIQNVFDPQSLNHYSYARNNPLIYTDPTGLAFESIRSGLSNFGSSTWNNFSSGISAIGNWGRQIWSTTIGDSSWRQGFGSGLGKSLGSLAIAGAIGIGIAFAPVTIPGGLTWGLGITSAIGLGISTGMAFTGTDLFSNELSSYQRGELAGGALLGWAGLGLGALESSKYWNYFGPESKPLGSRSWAVSGRSPPFGNNYSAAMDKLSAYNQWDDVRPVPVRWNEFMSGPRPAAPRWDQAKNTFITKGGGLEYRKGGFGNWKEYLNLWVRYRSFY